MTNRSVLVFSATVVAWIVQVAVATILITIVARLAGFSGFFMETMAILLIIYIPQFLLIFVPVAYLLNKLEQNGLIASAIGGIAASVVGIGFNYIWLTPFADISVHFDGHDLVETYKQLSLDIVTVSGGAAAGCGYWLVANTRKFADRRKARVKCDRPLREAGS